MSESVYEQHARTLARDLGVQEARRVTIQARNWNTPGSFAHGFHQAVLKQLERIAAQEAA